MAAANRQNSYHSSFRLKRSTLFWHLYDYGRGLYQPGVQRSMCCVPVCAAWRRS